MKIKLTLPSQQELRDLGIPSSTRELHNSFWARRMRTSTDLVTITGGVIKEYREWNSDNYNETFIIATSDSQDDNEIIPSIRPVIESEEIYEALRKKATTDEKGRLMVEFGEYPQWQVNKETRNSLEDLEYILYPTGRTFTIYEKPLYEYAYNGRKLIKVKFKIKEASDSKYTLDAGLNSRKLSGGYGQYFNGDSVWVEVLPVRWIIDDKNKRLIAESALVSGVSYDAIYDFMNNTMIRDMFQSLLITPQVKTSNPIGDVMEMADDQPKKL